jgi:beta-phosphoglucomutase
MMKAAIFDFDGTLIDNMRLHYESFQQALGKRLKISERELYMREGGRTLEIITDMTRNLSMDSYEIERIIEEKKRLYVEMAQGLKLRPEALTLISDLKGRGLLIGLATGSHRSALLPHMGPEEFSLFGFVITGDETQKPKPDPEPYLKCAEGLGVLPGECVVIENAPLGIESAKGAGMKCIALTSTMRREDLGRADFIIAGLGEALAIIKKL